MNKKPFVFAFSGGCCSGKTTALNALKDVLEKENFKVLVFKADSHLYLKERNTTIDKIRKSAPEYLKFQEFVCKEQWNFETQILQGLYDNYYDVILLDRALFDCQFYTTAYFNLGDEALQYGDYLDRYQRLLINLSIKLPESVEHVYNQSFCFAPLNKPKSQTDTYTRPANLKGLQYIEWQGIKRIVDNYHSANYPTRLSSKCHIDLNKTELEALCNFALRATKHYHGKL